MKQARAKQITYRQWLQKRDDFLFCGVGHGGYPGYQKRYEEERKRRLKMSKGNEFFIADPAWD